MTWLSFQDVFTNVPNDIYNNNMGVTKPSAIK